MISGATAPTPEAGRIGEARPSFVLEDVAPEPAVVANLIDEVRLLIVKLFGGRVECGEHPSSYAVSLSKHNRKKVKIRPGS